jgi:hypothetical protein
MKASMSSHSETATAINKLFGKLSENLERHFFALKLAVCKMELPAAFTQTIYQEEALQTGRNNFLAPYLLATCTSLSVYEDCHRCMLHNSDKFTFLL